MNNTFAMSYQTILKNELKYRLQRNPSYSLRAFAKALEMSAPHLSDILSGKKGLSLSSAQRIALILKFNADEQQTFCDLVTIKHSKRAKDIQEAKLRLKQNTERNSFQKIDSEEFKLIADWYHLAILHLLELDNFQSDSAWIARKLSLPESIVNEALDRLEKVQLIDRSKQQWKIKNKFSSTGDMPTMAIKNFHHQILKKASLAIDTQVSFERDLSAIIMACDEEKVPEAKRWIKEFRRKFCTHLDKSKSKNRVYCLAIQFFKISDLEDNL
ncbi:MAG: TIGR02147 family protein [Pseudobdellovibrionaceae bacterium]